MTIIYEVYIVALPCLIIVIKQPKYFSCCRSFRSQVDPGSYAMFND